MAAKKATTVGIQEGDPSRIQRRIDYLQKGNPNDPRIATQQQRLSNVGGAPGAITTPSEVPKFNGPGPISTPSGVPQFNSPGAISTPSGVPQSMTPGGITTPSGVPKRRSPYEPTGLPPATGNQPGMSSGAPPKSGIAPGTNKRKRPLIAKPRQFKSPQGITNLQTRLNEGAAQETSAISNPGYQSDVYGNTQTVTYDQNGRPIVNQTAGGTQGDILNAGENLDLYGKNSAMNMLGGFQGMPQFSTGNIDPKYSLPSATNEDRGAVQQAIYNNLTKNLDKQHDKELENTKQDLAQRGIPIGSQAYNQTVGDLETRYTDQKQSADSQAIQQSGQEMAQQFGLGLQGHQQAISDLGQNYNMPISIASGLANLGPGYQQGNFAPFQGAQVNPTNAVDPYQIAIQKALEEQKNRIAQQMANKSGGGGGGGGVAAPAAPGFGGVAGVGVAQ